MNSDALFDNKLQVGGYHQQNTEFLKIRANLII